MRLFEFELTWATAAFDAVLPENTALPHGIARMNPGRFLDDVIARASFEQALALRLTIWLVALAPLWFLRRPSTIASLLPRERQGVLERLLASNVYVVRQLVTAFKALASLLYAQSPDARRAMLEVSAEGPHGTAVPPALESGFVAIRTSRDAPPHGRARTAGGGTRAA